MPLREGAMRPTLRQLETFAAIAETLSFNQAAHRLSLSQSTLTAQIVALEKSLGVELFERSRSGTVLTSAGRSLLCDAHQAIEGFRQFVDRAASIRDDAVGIYRLGVTPTLGSYLMPYVVPALRGRFRGLKMSIREGSPRALEEELCSGQHDLILTESQVGDRRLIATPFLRESFSLLVSSNHSLAARSSVELVDLLGQSVLAIEEPKGFDSDLESLCSQVGAELRRDCVGTSLDSLCQMVVMGLGVALVPGIYARSKVSGRKGVHVVTIRDGSLARTHALAWRRMSPAANLFREIAEEVRKMAYQHLSGESEVIESRCGGESPD